MRRLLSVCAALATALPLALLGTHSAIAADPPQLSGALFTTDVTGVPVNLNHYAAKEHVYLNGGPGINAPDDAAGLPAGIYSFQVTDPSGKTLLSSDPVACRQVEVGADGVFGPSPRVGRVRTPPAPTARTAAPPSSCSPTTTPPTTAASTRCGSRSPRTWTAMLRGTSTASSRARARPTTSRSRRRRSSRSTPGSGRRTRPTPLTGSKAIWIDTVGASNIKYSEYNPAILAFHEAHVEAAEQGNHKIYRRGPAGLHDRRRPRADRHDVPARQRCRHGPGVGEEPQLRRQDVLRRRLLPGVS